MSGRLAAALRQALNDRAQADFLNCGDGWISAARFLAQAEEFAKSLSLPDDARQCRIVVPSGRSRFWIELCGCWMAGATAVPLDGDLKAEIRDDILNQIAPARIPAWNAEHPGPQPSSPFPAAAILFTSGTTGRAKGVSLRGEVILANAQGALRRLAAADNDVMFVNTPYHFTSAICHFLAAALGGWRALMIHRRLLQGELADTFVDFSATAYGGAPAQVHWLASGLPEGCSPRWFMSSGDHLSPATIGLIRQRFPLARIHTVYGMTELGGRLCFLPPDLAGSHAGSVGWPLDGYSLAILDEDGRPVPVGETGEVVVRTDLAFDGYWERPEETVRTKTTHGIHTGDLGWLAPDGCLTLAGRKDDVFKCGGSKVAIPPIVDALRSTGFFGDVAVAPAPHPVLGHVPVAVYVADTDIDPSRIVPLLRGILPAAHVPKTFLRVDCLPRTGSGKIRRSALAAMVADVHNR